MRMRAVLALLLCAAVSATTVSEQRVLAEMEAEMKEKGISIPFYGNWCGPGYPKPGENPKTIDKVDLACKHHDQCYSRKGYFDCGCNTGLMREIPKLPSDCKSALCKKRYGQIMAIFRNMFCVCRNAQASLAGFKWKTKAFTVFNPSKCTATARFAARRTVDEKKKGKKKKKSTKKKKKPAKKRTTKKTKGKKGKGKTPKGKKPKGKKAKGKKAKGNKTKGKKAKGKKSKKAAVGKKKKKAAAGKKKKSAGAKKKDKKKKSKDAKKKDKKKKSSKSESSSSASSTNKKKIEKAIEKAMTAAAVRSAAQATCNGLSNFLKPKHARGRSRMLGSFHKSGNADADYAAKYFSDLLKKKVKSVSPCAIH